MASPNSTYEFADGYGASQYQIVVLPAGLDANNPGDQALALVDVVVANSPDDPESYRLGDLTEPAAVPAGNYVIQARTFQPQVTSFNAPLAFSYAPVARPGDGSLVD